MGVVSRSHAARDTYLLSSTLDSAIGLLGIVEVTNSSQISKRVAIIRQGKLNSQFIVTDFSVLHAGGRSLLRFQTSIEYEKC
jgi:hypothetical protein